jgi:hypothetical protein
MATIEFIKEQADKISVELKSRQYIADFSPQSLREIERFFENRKHKGKDEPGDLLHAWPDDAEGKLQRENRIFSLGAYVGEVVRRNLYEWICDDLNALQPHFRLPAARLPLFPMKLIEEQIRNYQHGNIVEWGNQAGLKLGESPKH